MAERHGYQSMRRLLMFGLLAGFLAVAGAPASAHHSMTKFEFLASTIEGTVEEFRYINPHCIIVLKVSGANGDTTLWHLEGDPPATMARAGLSRDTFQPGDRLKMEFHKLRDGQPGGFWSLRMIIKQNGREFVGHQCLSSPGGCEPL
jgi:hypothetical protein